MEWIISPWPWYVSGPLISLVMFLLLFMGKQFGMSSNLRTLCSMVGGGKIADFFRFDWKSQRWNLVVMLGVIFGGFLGRYYMTEDPSVAISAATVGKLQGLGFKSAGTAYLPQELFGNGVFGDMGGMLLLLIGGLLIGFGARYAGGCTSGHAISGLSNLQMPSFIAVIGFFIGGLLMVHLLFPFIF
ncbi:MAG: YeeE/YedE thiosulfate transporter family protein [Sediminicola sp.]|tara:strand:- start:103459 stop:104016 length:558 start_codon:yes stop_codon:yes gene_type:complete